MQTLPFHTYWAEGVATPYPPVVAVVTKYLLHINSVPDYMDYIAIGEQREDRKPGRKPGGRHVLRQMGCLINPVS